MDFQLVFAHPSANSANKKSDVQKREIHFQNHFQNPFSEPFPKLKTSYSSKKQGRKEVIKHIPYWGHKVEKN